MTLENRDAWSRANQEYLTATLREIRQILEKRLGKESHGDDSENGYSKDDTASSAFDDLHQRSALETLCEGFQLSSFERSLLLLCAGVELDSAFSSLYAAAQGNGGGPTFSLALGAFPDAHWSAIAPSGPLRFWRLIEVGSGSSLVHSPLRINERILHYLTGLDSLDEDLAGFASPIASISGDLTQSHQKTSEQIARIWSSSSGALYPEVVQLCGNDALGKRMVAATAASLLGLKLFVMPVQAMPAGAPEFESLVRLWRRESFLSRAALLVDGEETGSNDAAHELAIVRFLDKTPGPLLLASREGHALRFRHSVNFDVSKPTAEEQSEIWRLALGPAASLLNRRVDELASQFDLSAAAIRSASSHALDAQEDLDSVHAETLGRRLWEACRLQIRTRLRDLAQRIEPAASWEDLVLPAKELEILRDAALQVKRRKRVYEDWGFASKCNRGLGISALFSGASGTGKTMAAEVLANELNLDLYRIDLSSVVSKYIGETEKNLRRVFDAAEEGGAILLFDEADALFGKRTEVRDSHDRYANIETSYLLQRMEAYRGLAILTTNMKEALDDAFMRRIRFIVNFPFPDATQRERIWERIFPDAAPTRDLDYKKLARLNVTGGGIRNIAMQAAFLAAEEESAVSMTHLLQAARRECMKMDKQVTDGEMRGWA